MLTNRVLVGGAVLVLVAMAFFQGTAAGASPLALDQAPSSDHCSMPIRQQLGTVLPQMTAADEGKLCNDLYQPATSSVQTTGDTCGTLVCPDIRRDTQMATVSVPTTGGANNSCVAPIRQKLGTVWPRMGAAQEAEICASFQ